MCFGMWRLLWPIKVQQLIADGVIVDHPDNILMGDHWQVAMSWQMAQCDQVRHRHECKHSQ